jgi:nucleoside-diphosphate-sugar epimerase
VNPISPYSVTKYAGERLCRMFRSGRGWPVVMVRPFNAYGPAQSPDRVIPEIIVRALRGQDLKMTAGRQTREFNFVEDLAEGFLLAATVAGIEGELFNLGCGQEISMRDLATTVLRLLGDPVEARFGALPERPTEINRMYADTERATQRLGYAPRHTLEAGLERTIAWYEAELAREDSPFLLP